MCPYVNVLYLNIIICNVHDKEALISAKNQG